MRKIVSGGQTGADQAALRAALACGLAIGGWCPPGRVSEDGTIPEIFPLKETPEERSQNALDVPRSQRTEWNVRDSDATLILWPGTFDKRDLGTRYTVDCALRYKKHFLVCDPGEQNDIDKAREWIIRNNIETLNVSGPSERTSPGIGASAEQFLRQLLTASRCALPEKTRAPA
jgi:Circularly permutated YpsA SLOG family